MYPYSFNVESRGSKPLIDEQDLYSKILTVFRGDETQKMGDFKPTRYASILWIATYLKNYRSYVLNIENYICFNFYRLGKVAEQVRIHYDRGKQARKVFDELEKTGEVRIFGHHNKTYVCLTEKGMTELSQKIQELWNLDYHASLNVPTHTSKILQESYDQVQSDRKMNTSALPSQQLRVDTKAPDELADSETRMTNKMSSNEKLPIYNGILALRIIVVDDEPDVSASLKVALEDSGFEVDTFTDPLMALSQFRKKVYDVALLDVRMPGMDGFDLFEQMLKINVKVIVLFITAYQVYYEAVKEREPVITIENFMVKPVKLETMIKRIITAYYHKDPRIIVDNVGLVESKAEEYIDKMEFENVLRYSDDVPIKLVNSSEL